MSEDTREQPNTPDIPDMPEVPEMPEMVETPDTPDAAEGDPVGATGDAAHADGPNFTLVDGESSRATPAAAAAPTDSRDADAAAGAAASATAKDGAPGTESAAGTAAGPGPSDAADTPPPDSLAALRDRVDQLERDLAHERDQATEYLNRWQRAQADMSNLRRRADQERDQLHAFAAWQAVAFALPAIDSLERAFQTLPEPLTGLTWINGVALVDHQLRQAVAALGVTEIAADPGQPLDHTRHQPVAEHETATHPEGTIALVVQRGYEINGHILRPTLVAVARPPRSDPAPNAGEHSPGERTADEHGASPAGEAPPGSSP